MGVLTHEFAHSSSLSSICAVRSLIGQPQKSNGHQEPRSWPDLVLSTNDFSWTGPELRMIHGFLGPNIHFT